MVQLILGATNPGRPRGGQAAGDGVPSPALRLRAPDAGTQHGSRRTVTHATRDLTYATPP